MADVLPTINNEPPQGIQAMLDTIYLWNPDVANELIEKVNELLEEIGNVSGTIRPYSELTAPVLQYMPCYDGDNVYVAARELAVLPAELNPSDWILIATKAPVLQAGTGISIDGNEISVTQAISDGAAAGSTAVQPNDLGTAAYAASSDFATAAQGTKADTAVQPSDLGSAAYVDSSVFQEALVSGTNIKTIDGNTILGSGNLDLPAYSPFPQNWPTTGTTKAFCDAVAADSSAVEGRAYLGEVTLSDLPAGIGNSELVVEIMTGSTAASKVITLTLTSGNVAPYMWKYTYWNNGTNVSDWQTWATAAQGAKADTAVQPGDLATVATTGSYNDLMHKPTIPAAQVNSDWTATSGVAEILHKPTLGTAAAEDTTAFATAAQGTKADTAVQPGDLGTAAYAATTDFATSTQGGKADTALQPADIVDNLTSTATNKALSANQGKELEAQIVALEGRGRYLSSWNCATGLAGTNPPTSPYTYTAGDYFIVGTVDTTTNYRPSGSQYVTGTASTTVETEQVAVNDTYTYDGTNWSLLKTSKVDALPPQTGNAGKFLTTDGTDASWATVDALPSQTGKSGKFLKTNGTTASWANAVENNAEGSYGFSVGPGNHAYGTRGTVVGSESISYANETVFVGNYIRELNGGSNNVVAIGANIQVGYNSPSGVCIGNYSGLNAAASGIAIGNSAKSTAAYAIQLGVGTNSEAGTFCIGTRYNNNPISYKLMDADGTIPADRLPNAINKYSAMPTAASTNLGWIVQYIGTTDSNYTHGYIYECVSDGAVSPTYSWRQLDVQPGATMTNLVVTDTLPGPDSAVAGTLYLYTGTTGTISQYPFIGGSSFAVLTKGRFYRVQSVFEGVDPDTMEDMYSNYWIEHLPNDYTRTIYDSNQMDSGVFQFPGVMDYMFPEGTVVQYLGASTGGRVNGYFYTVAPTPEEASVTANSSTITDAQVDVGVYGVACQYTYAEWTYDSNDGWVLTICQDFPEDEGQPQDIANFGITYTGTPSDSDTIIVSYSPAGMAHEWVQKDVQPTPDSLPDQTGQSGKYLTTNGTTASWAAVEVLPSQSGNSGKLLTTNGTTASWDTKANLGLSGVTLRTWGANE